MLLGYPNAKEHRNATCQLNKVDPQMSGLGAQAKKPVSAGNALWQEYSLYVHMGSRDLCLQSTDLCLYKSVQDKCFHGRQRAMLSLADQAVAHYGPIIQPNGCPIGVAQAGQAVSSDYKCTVI